MAIETQTPSEKAGTLSTELRALLLELATAINKRVSYPAQHPVQSGAVEGVLARVADALATRAQLSIGVARQQIIVDGVRTEADHPLLRDLVRGLHNQNVGALRIRAGLQASEVDALLTFLSSAATMGEQNGGARPSSTLPKWGHLELYGMSYDRLGLLDERDEAKSESAAESRSHDSQLWLGLVRAALAGRSADDQLDNPKRVAESIGEHAGDQAYNQVIVGYLLQCVDALKSGDPEGNRTLRQRVSELVENLSAGGIAHLLRMGGSAEQRNEFLRNATSTLTATAVVDLVNVAAAQNGTPITHSVLRLLSKLAQDGGSPQHISSESDDALRSVVRRLMAGWTLKDPNPEAYSMFLADVAERDVASRPDLQRDTCEPERVLEISLDAGIIAPSTEIALQQLVERDGVVATVARLQSAGSDPRVEAMVDRLLNEESLSDALSATRLEIPVLERTVDRLRVSAVSPLLDALETRPEGDATSILALLQRVGKAALPTLGASFPTLGIASQRQLVRLFDQLDTWPRALSPSAFAVHEDATLRREAIRFLLKHSETRSAGVLHGLRDEDLRIFNLALSAVMGDCPLEAAQVIMARFSDPSLNAELRARAMKAVGTAHHSSVRQWLVAQATTKRWLLGSLRLRKTSMELLAALSAMAAQAENAPEVAAVLTLARRSRDEKIRLAVRPRAAVGSVGDD